MRDKLVRISSPVIAPLAPSQDTTSDQLAAFYRPTPLPFVRHSPLPVAGQSASGAAGKSVSQTTSIRSIVGVVRNQSQIAPSTINAGIVPTLLSSSTSTIQNLVFLCGTTTIVTTGTDGAVVSAANAIDGNLSTFAQILINTSGSANATASLILSGIPSVQSSGGLTLFVKSAVPSNHISNANSAKLSYSFDGGSTFTNFFSLGATTTRGITTDSVPIPNNMNLALIRINAVASRTSGVSQAAEIDLYEAYIGTA